jgi:MurNAc alpha-1-phosphate uridylyltransferase
MRAMILAAGHGKRMLPLTEHTPKPLLTVKGKSFLEHHLSAFARAGIENIVINLGYLGHKIEKAIGNGHAFNVNVEYSYEDPILETGGGIAKALPLLGTEPFIVVSGDIFTDYPFQQLPKQPLGLVHLVLTDNPPHHPTGDFGLEERQGIHYVIEANTDPLQILFNFAGIAVYRSELFTDCPKGIFPVAPLIRKAIQANKATGEHYAGIWHNIGTPEQLQDCNNQAL